MNGVFISFEGVEGAGKSTLIGSIRQQLDASAIDYLATREPGGNPTCERIRELLLHRRELHISATAELLLMFASRAHLLEQDIRPALASGRLVLSDRFTDASYAYQGAGRELGFASVAAIERVVHPDLQPDLTLFLDLPVAAGIARKRHQQPDRIERETLAFFERVRDGYLRRIEQQPQRFLCLDASQPAAAVAAAAWSGIRQLLQSRGLLLP
ncbi:MAG: dTMP kinase [Wenzhouxiangellaceae bacterium]